MVVGETLPNSGLNLTAVVTIDIQHFFAEYFIYLKKIYVWHFLI
jgi:hypothetical protein